MLILIVFAFLGGVVTILSPCILAVLPIILSGTTGGKRRPLGVVIGFISAFTFFTLFLSTIVSILGISADVLRYVAIVILAVFGLVLIIPKLQLQIELLFTKLASKAPNNQNRSGFSGGLVVGASLGLLWTPCVGPILASVISLALAGSVNGSAIIITLAYAIGTAIPMFTIMIGGRKLMSKIPWLTSNAVKIQQMFGVLMIMTSLAIVFNVDRALQAWVTERLPNYAENLTDFENNKLIEKELDKLEGIDDPVKINLDSESDFPIAPEFIPGGE